MNTAYECEYRHWLPTRPYLAQVHSAPYLYLLRSGNLRIEGTGLEADLDRHGVVWWPSGTPATIETEHSETIGHILRLRRSGFAPHLIADAEALDLCERCERLARTRSPLLPLDEQTVRILHRRVERMGPIWHDQSPYRALQLKAEALIILGILADDSLLQEALADLPGGGHDQRIADLLGWLDEHLNQELGIDELAERTNLARSRFTQVFRAHTGRSPQDYLRRMRIARACRLLRHSDRSVTEVCYAVGFGSPARFHAAFQTVLGMPPGRWRRTQVS